MSAKLFPIMGGPSIPWAMIEPHARQAWQNHGQTLERLAERGGLDVSEALAVLEDRRYRDMSVPLARLEFQKLVEADRTARIAALERELDLGGKALAHVGMERDNVARENKRLERELAEAKATAADAESQAEHERSQRQMEIGAQEYRGNTISYIYDKCANYGRQAANIIRERDEVTADRDRLRKALERMMPARNNYIDCDCPACERFKALASAEKGDS